MNSFSGKMEKGGYRWLICALLFFATTVNYMDRQVLSLLKPILDDRFHWTNEEFGIVNSVFQGAYGVGLLGFGWLVDRFGVKVGYALSITIWSLAAMAHGLVGSVGGFIQARIALGLGEGGNFPSAIKAVALWFPKRERAFATTLFNSGSNIGPIIAPAIVPWIAFSWGWQWAFVSIGGAGLLWLFLWFRFYDSPAQSLALSSAERQFIQSDLDEAANDAGAKPSWASLLRYRQAWSFIVAKFMTDPIWWFFLIWLPDYFKKTRNLDLKHSWVHLVTIYALITVLSTIGGWMSGYLARRGWTITRARKTCMFIFACCVLPIFAVTRVGPWTAVMLIGLAGAAHQAWSANLFTTVSDMFPKPAVASLTGMGGTAGAIGGMFFPLYCGWLLDKFSAKGNVTGGYAVLFCICALSYLVTFAIQHLLAPNFEPVKLRNVSVQGAQNGSQQTTLEPPDLSRAKK